MQKTFTTSLMDSIERGVGQLVDADMNKESTRLQALQVQQQLGIQALSIANANSQSILSLFRVIASAQRLTYQRTGRAQARPVAFCSCPQKRRILRLRAGMPALNMALTISPVFMVNQSLMAG